MRNVLRVIMMSTLLAIVGGCAIDGPEDEIDKGTAHAESPPDSADSPDSIDTFDSADSLDSVDPPDLAGPPDSTDSPDSTVPSDSTDLPHSMGPTDPMDLEGSEVRAIDPVTAMKEARDRAFDARQFSYFDSSKPKSDIPLPKNPGGMPPAEWQDCMSKPGADSSAGWVYSRFLWCQRAVITLVYETTTILGFADFIGAVEIAFEAVAVGRIDQRSIRVYLHIPRDSVRTITPPVVDLFTFLKFMTFTDLYQNSWVSFDPTCTDDGRTICGSTPGPVKASYPVWNSGSMPWMWWEIGSHPPPELGGDKVSFHTWSFKFGDEGRGSQYTSESTHSEHTIRCDSANYFKGDPHACLF